MCNSRIQINLSKKEGYITRLHSNECLEYMFGINIIIPSINKEIKKREEVIEFANKLLFINSSINLSTFKAVIYRMIANCKFTNCIYQMI